jgi:hypothetical protein
LKPVTDKLEAIPKSITSALEPTLAALPSNISHAIWPQLPTTGFTPATSGFTTPQAMVAPLQIEDISVPNPSLEVPQSSIEFGDIASQYMNSLMACDTDTIFGIHTKEGQTPGTFFIGTKPVQIAGNDLIINYKT